MDKRKHLKTFEQYLSEHLLMSDFLADFLNLK